MVPSARAWLSFLAELNPLAVILRVPRVESRSVSSMPGRAYFVYVMSSLSRTLYTGVTNDLERRVAEHKEGKPGSFTARYNVTRLVYLSASTTSATRLPARRGSSGCCAHRRLR